MPHRSYARRPDYVPNARSKHASDRETTSVPHSLSISWQARLAPPIEEVLGIMSVLVDGDALPSRNREARLDSQNLARLGSRLVHRCLYRKCHPIDSVINSVSVGGDDLGDPPVPGRLGVPGQI